ncbi:MAG TPA: polysaccharide biosynthesis/export family protein [Blastocatellia bacterium]|nr:polysaccharide biosynthesis/export family protein [Blastocatellia bacterium]
MKIRTRGVKAYIGTLALLSSVSAVAFTTALPMTTRGQDRRQQTKQYQPTPRPASDPMIPSVIISPGEDYRIGPSDVIEVVVDDAPELSRTFRVSGDGTISVPFLGGVVAQQKTPNELAAIIADRLRGDYLQSPQVSVTVLQINSRTYFLQGSVRRPGLYQIEGDPSLLKLITIGGGLSENHGSTAFIIREIKGGATIQGRQSGNASMGGINSKVNGDLSNASSVLTPDAPHPTPDPAASAKYELLKVSINGLLRGNFDQNIAIGPGDIVHIPPTDVFFVAGEVNAPGSFPLKEGTTLRQAISLAQGATFQAAASRSIIFREDPVSGKRQEIQVDVPAVMNGKKEDLPILANDIVIVPNSRVKSVTGTLLRAFGVNATRIPVRYGY